MAEQYVIGIDFGSDSVRAIVVDAISGRGISEAHAAYRRWGDGRFQHPEKQVFRQHPLDYIESFTEAVNHALDEAGAAARRKVVGIACATTGSTPCPVNRTGIPLALLEGFENNENAMFHMWKDHSSIAEAEEINRVFSNWKGQDYTRYQGAYSSEWYWAKILRVAREDKIIRECAFSWVEHSDWMPALLTGRSEPSSIYRSACAAGHKALWHSAWGGLPSYACLSSLDEHLAWVARTFSPPQPADCKVGTLTPEWAEKLGLPTSVVVGGASFDAHAGGVGAGITRGTMVSAVGTSCVDLLVEQAENLHGKTLTHTCGMAENSIIPGLIGIESGQAAFGDVYAWFANLLLWPVEQILASAGDVKEQQRDIIVAMLREKTLPNLEKQAGKLQTPDQLVSIDWLNGRRYPNGNEAVTGAITGLTLGTSAPEIYRSLALATVFGTRRIFDSLRAGGVAINQVVTVGGIARRSPFIMQMMADALNCPIGVCSSKEAVARGAAIYAASAAGLYPDIPTAQQHLCEDLQMTYTPTGVKSIEYEKKYREYCAVGNYLETMQA